MKHLAESCRTCCTSRVRSEIRQVQQHHVVPCCAPTFPDPFLPCALKPDSIRSLPFNLSRCRLQTEMLHGNARTLQKEVSQ